MTDAKTKRAERLMPNGIPRYVRCYDNAGTKNETCDRYTIVFTHADKFGCRGFYLGSSEFPFHPQGVGQTGESSDGWPIDRPTSAHLGKRIKFEALSPDAQRFVAQIYRECWGLK